jgi:hypothetical protein
MVDSGHPNAALGRPRLQMGAPALERRRRTRTVPPALLESWWLANGGYLVAVTASCRAVRGVFSFDGCLPEETRVPMTTHDPTTDETELLRRAAQANRLNRFLKELHLDVSDVEADPSLLEPICDMSGEIIPDSMDLPRD